MTNEELTEGTNPEELFTSQEIHKVEIPYKGKMWKIEYVDLTWKQKNDCITSAHKLQVSGTKKKPIQSVRLDPGEYNLSYLMKALKKAPFPITMGSFMKMDDAFGDLLVDAVIKDDTDADFRDSDDACED